MKVLKIVAIVLVVLAAVVLGGAAFLPSEYAVERSVTIDAAPETVYPHVVKLENWKPWNPWGAQDPDAEFTYAGNSGEVGSSMSWNGEVVGVGTLTFTAKEENKSISTKLEFKEPSVPASQGYWQFEREGKGTKVVWGNKGNLDYPIGRWFGLVMDGMLGGDFEAGLQSLKKQVESK